MSLPPYGRLGLKGSGTRFDIRISFMFIYLLFCLLKCLFLKSQFCTLFDCICDMQCIRCLRQTSAFASSGASNTSTQNEREVWWISRWAYGCPMCGGTWVRVV